MGDRELTAPFVCTGMVRDAQGAPVAGAVVMVIAGSAPTPEIAIKTRDDGTFRVGLPLGHFTLAAYGRDGRKARRSVVVDAVPASIDLVFDD